MDSATPATASVPGPKGSLLLGNLMEFHEDPLAFMERNAALGDLTRFRFLNLRCWQVVHPDHVRAVLVERQASFVKGMALEGFRPLVGDGLFLAEGDRHRRQRRMMQPLFHREPVLRYAEVMLQEIAALDARWQDGARVDMAEEMNLLALNIAARTLFGTGISEEETAAVREAMSAFALWYHQSTHPLGPLLQVLPTEASRRFKAGRRGLTEVLRRMIQSKRASGDSGDILSRLVFARDTEGDGAGLSEELLQDEAVGLLVAGHETTAATLCWAWYLLAQSPDAAERVAREAEEIACNRTLQVEDLPKLRLAESAFAETLRLYPPANALPRQAVEPVHLGEVELQKGDIVMASSWCTHRDARWWPDPLRFQLERWTPEARAARPRFAFYPFGGGARTCIGETFAWAEGTLALAALGRRWRAILPQDHKIEVESLFTLRPKGGMPMTLASRGASRY